MGACYIGRGSEMTVDEVLAEVEQDSGFYRESGGGITLSGGECLLQPDFSAALLEEAHQRGINTAIETAGNVPWAFMEKVLRHVDIVQHDRFLEIATGKGQMDPAYLAGLKDKYVIAIKGLAASAEQETAASN